MDELNDLSFFFIFIFSFYAPIMPSTKELYNFYHTSFNLYPQKLNYTLYNMP